MMYKDYDDEFMKTFDMLFMNRSIKTIIVIGYRKESCISDICYDTRSQYSYIFNGVLPRLLNMGIIEERKIGKKRMIKLTNKGLEVFKRFDEITDIVLGDLIVSERK